MLDAEGRHALYGYHRHPERRQTVKVARSFHGGVRYNPGNQVTTDPSLHSGHTGQRWDSGTSLYHYGARWYDPAIGRFIQPDTGNLRLHSAGAGEIRKA